MSASLTVFILMIVPNVYNPRDPRIRRRPDFMAKVERPAWFYGPLDYPVPQPQFVFDPVYACISCDAVFFDLSDHSRHTRKYCRSRYAFGVPVSGRRRRRLFI